MHIHHQSRCSFEIITNLKTNNEIPKQNKNNNKSYSNNFLKIKNRSLKKNILQNKLQNFGGMQLCTKLGVVLTCHQHQNNNNKIIKASKQNKKTTKTIAIDEKKKKIEG
jgi:hypothetical protein